VSAKPWQERIDDILVAIAEIETFPGGISRDQFMVDPKTQKAVAADLTIVGEAARHVPESVAQNYPEIPWLLIQGMRNHIVHGYYQVDPTIVWETCQNDLKPLIEPLRKMQHENPRTQAGDS
jgi:uncharacterized protein with HEPN domain